MVSPVTLHVLCRQFSPLNILTGLGTFAYTKSKILWLTNFFLFWVLVILFNQLSKNPTSIALKISSSIICIIYAFFLYVAHHELHAVELKYNAELQNTTKKSFISSIKKDELYIPTIPYTMIHYVTVEYITLINVAVVYPFICYRLSRFTLIFTGFMTFMSIVLSYTLHILVYVKTCQGANLYTRISTVYYIIAFMLLSYTITIMICYKSRLAILQRKRA